MIDKFLLRYSLICLGALGLTSGVCAADKSSDKAEGDVQMPSLDIHGSMGMGHYSINQADPASTYSGMGLGYFFRPSLYAISSVTSGDTTIEAISGLTVKPTASLLNQDMSGNPEAGAVGFNLMDSGEVNFNEWTLTATNPTYGRFEMGKSATVSAKSGMASFSPFHRMRGGYEDVVTTYTQGIPGSPVAPLIAYFGATGMLLDAPHMGYTTPEHKGFTLTAEMAPSDYIGDIGGVKKHAYAMTAQYQKECGDIRYDARLAFAGNVLNGYPDVTVANDGVLLTTEQLIFGDQFNASIALGYKQWDASFSYGKETGSSEPSSGLVSGMVYGDIKPYIYETAVGYTFNNVSIGGNIGVQATYAVADNYLRYVHNGIDASSAKMVGIGVGHFIGNMTVEMRAQRYTTSNSLMADNHSGNIFSVGTLYLF